MDEKKDLNEQNIREVLKEVYDPEIPVNIIDLGLVYEVEVLPDQVVDITMTLTAMGCPMVGEFMDSIKEAVGSAIKNVKHVNVNITFDPPWNPSMVNEEALLALGMNTAPQN